MTEPFLVVESDRRNHRDDRLGCIRCVEPTTHAGFENDKFCFVFLKMEESKCGYDLKECWMWIPACDEIADFGQVTCNVIFGDLFPINLNSFTKCDEVRGGEETGAITLRAADGIDHRANGTFAVRAGDVNDFGLPGAAASRPPDFAPARKLSGQLHFRRFGKRRSLRSQITSARQKGAAHSPGRA